ncbi:hypothetical protein Mgra_00006140 [Meloidogyne graminicola]|uniref:Uncharacterized protein n=1 Tax=Meloidogyne graminicola TaxID=189291 RepID=A0A8S9ZMC6_9BILA|nr:hypothetical protein Mgra_00006140 [Meloidogyne graminicola]
MLSLLSLLLASGTVLRADTERWTPMTYPNPRKNHTACNTQENSTLCDPDHILTDQWRIEINQNIQKQMKSWLFGLTEANVPLSDKAPIECINRTEGVLVYVLLAKRIWTPNNQSITGNDLTKFGDELAVQWLGDLPCKTFLLLIGIEAAKLAYVRTGKDLRLPADLMQKVFHEYKLFNANNFMAGLNKIEQSLTTLNPSLHNSSEISTSTEGTTLAEIMAEILQVENNGTAVDGEVKGEIKESSTCNCDFFCLRKPPCNLTHTRRCKIIAHELMFIFLCIAIIIVFSSLALLAVSQRRRYEQITKKSIQQYTAEITQSWKCQCQKIVENKGKEQENQTTTELDDKLKETENTSGLKEKVDSIESLKEIEINEKSVNKSNFYSFFCDENINRRVHINANELLTDVQICKKIETDIINNDLNKKEEN